MDRAQFFLKPNISQQFYFEFFQPWHLHSDPYGVSLSIQH